jgi:NADPH2:quinone reductase
MIDDPELLDIRLYKSACVSIHWESMFARPMWNTYDMMRQHEILNKTAELIDVGTILPINGKNLGTINAANLREAHALIESDKSIGKIVLSGF